MLNQSVAVNLFSLLSHRQPPSLIISYSSWLPLPPSLLHLSHSPYFTSSLCLPQLAHFSFPVTPSPEHTNTQINVDLHAPTQRHILAHRNHVDDTIVRTQLFSCLERLQGVKVSPLVGVDFVQDDIRLVLNQ